MDGKKIFLFNQFIKNSCHHFIKGSIKNNYPTISSNIFDKLINSKRNVFNITKESIILIERTSETMQLKSINKIIKRKVIKTIFVSKNLLCEESFTE